MNVRKKIKNMEMKLGDEACEVRFSETVKLQLFCNILFLFMCMGLIVN